MSDVFNAEAAQAAVAETKNAPLNRIVDRFIKPAARKGKSSIKLRYWVNKRKREFLTGLGFTVEKTSENIAGGRVQKFTVISW